MKMVVVVDFVLDFDFKLGSIGIWLVDVLFVYLCEVGFVV